MTRINHLEQIIKDTADTLKVHRKDLIHALDNGGLANLFILAKGIVDPPKPVPESTDGLYSTFDLKLKPEYRLTKKTLKNIDESDPRFGKFYEYQGVCYRFIHTDTHMKGFIFIRYDGNGWTLSGHTMFNDAILEDRNSQIKCYYFSNYQQYFREISEIQALKLVHKDFLL